jgi:cobalt-zinc-cadmium efflux system protein
MISDAISSIGIILAAIVIILTGWNIIDPLVSLLISGLILYWAWGILKESSRVLLETAPIGLNVDIIGNDLKKNFSEIKNLNKMHLWTIIPEMVVFSAHISLKNNQRDINKEELVTKINKYLSSRYNIIESTIQITTNEELIC